MAYDSKRALALLRIGTGDPAAEFRDGQEDAIEHVVENRGRLLLVQRAGWGKSFVYFIATKLLREQGAGPALLISPLLALMRNQIDAARRMGVKAERIDSSNTDDWDRINKEILNDQIDILLVSPERLGNQSFVEEVFAPAAERVSTLIVDEAHCISDWGHDFRPDYQRIDRILSSLPLNLRLLATTATANDRVMEDLEGILGPGLEIMRGPLGLPSVKLQTIRMPDRAERMAWLADTIPKLEGSGIIYVLTIRDAERVAEWLSNRGIVANAYHGSMRDERSELEQRLLANEMKCLVATTALGMGFDKPDLGFVIHFQTPGSVVAYYQQVGRAGRAINSAYGVLLSGEEDDEINDYFITSAFPTPDEAGEILKSLEDSPEGLSMYGLQGNANIRGGRIEQSLKILALQSPAPIVKEGSKWKRTTTDVSNEFWDRVERLTEIRRNEVAQMRDYVALGSNHMQFLVEAMDCESRLDTHSVDIPSLPVAVHRLTVVEALEFMRGESIMVSPRKRWPVGAYRDKAGIDGERQAEEGRALCVYGDSGWGQLVRKGKYSQNRFDDELLDAVGVMYTKWNPDPSPAWLTCLPSARPESPVSDFAKRLASRLGIPFIEVLTKRTQTAEQKDMHNAAHKVRNAAGALQVVSSPDPRPVLLVDDIVDSGWSFTVATWKLREAGSGPVLPLAIASKGGR